MYSVRHSLCDSSPNWPPLVPAGPRAATWELVPLSGLCGGLQTGSFVLPSLGQCWEEWEVLLGAVGCRGWEVSLPPPRAPSDPSSSLEGAHERLHSETHLPPPWMDKEPQQNLLWVQRECLWDRKAGHHSTELVGTGRAGTGRDTAQNCRHPAEKCLSNRPAHVFQRLSSPSITGKEMLSSHMGSRFN